MYCLTKHLRFRLRHSAAWDLERTQCGQPALDTVSEVSPKGAPRLGAAWWTTEAAQSLTLRLASGLVGPDVQDC